MLASPYRRLGRLYGSFECVGVSEAPWSGSVRNLSAARVREVHFLHTNHPQNGLFCQFLVLGDWFEALCGTPWSIRRGTSPIKRGPSPKRKGYLGHKKRGLKGYRAHQKRGLQGYLAGRACRGTSPTRNTPLLGPPYDPRYSYCRVLGGVFRISEVLSRVL